MQKIICKTEGEFVNQFLRSKSSLSLAETKNFELKLARTVLHYISKLGNSKGIVDFGTWTCPTSRGTVVQCQQIPCC